MSAVQLISYYTICLTLFFILSVSVERVSLWPQCSLNKTEQDPTLTLSRCVLVNGIKRISVIMPLFGFTGIGFARDASLFYHLLEHVPNCSVCAVLPVHTDCY